LANAITRIKELEAIIAVKSQEGAIKLPERTLKTPFQTQNCQQITCWQKYYIFSIVYIMGNSS